MKPPPRRRCNRLCPAKKSEPEPTMSQSSSPSPKPRIGTTVEANPDRKRKRFFKVMTPGFLSKISIPLSFSKSLETEKLRRVNVVLVTEKGSWDVNVGDCDDKGCYWFEEGWERFAKDNDLRVGDFIVFEYEGNGRFRAFVFCASGCEKRCFDSGDEEDVGRRQRERSRVLGKVIYNKRCKGKNLNVASLIPPSNPHFITTMFPSNGSRPYMYIPSTFTKVNLIDVPRSMILRDPSKRLWPVKVHSCHRKEGSVKEYHHFKDGWMEFYGANKLKTGDVCIFELNPNNVAESGEKIMDVHIYPH